MAPAYLQRGILSGFDTPELWVAGPHRPCPRPGRSPMAPTWQHRAALPSARATGSWQPAAQTTQRMSARPMSAAASRTRCCRPQPAQACGEKMCVCKGKDKACEEKMCVCAKARIRRVGRRCVRIRLGERGGYAKVRIRQEGRGQGRSIDGEGRRGEGNKTCVEVGSGGEERGRQEKAGGDLQLRWLIWLARQR
eukprot:358327-Chlamydomonas_euryale.AAC.2